MIDCESTHKTHSSACKARGVCVRRCIDCDGCYAPINLRLLQSRAPCFVADVIGALLTQPRVHRFHTIGQNRLYGPHGSVRSVETAAQRLVGMRAMFASDDALDAVYDAQSHNLEDTHPVFYDRVACVVCNTIHDFMIPCPALVVRYDVKGHPYVSGGENDMEECGKDIYEPEIGHYPCSDTKGHEGPCGGLSRDMGGVGFEGF